VKVGAENRTKLIAAVSLGVLSLVLVASRFVGLFGFGSSSAAAPAPANISETREPVLRDSPRASAKNRNGGKQQKATQSLDPTLRTDVLKISEDTKYEGTGRNIFRVFVEPPPKPVKDPVLDHKIADNTPPPPPPPPPINLKFYGFATPIEGSKRIFLAEKEDVFIAKEGDIVDRRYKVVRISPNAVEILDVLSNNRQSIPLTQG
jgi:hypothetical protein